VKSQRGLGGNVGVHLAVERRYDAAGSFGFDGVDRLIDHTKTEICARNGLASRVSCLDGVGAGLSWLILRLGRLQVPFEYMLRGRNREALVAYIQLIAADEGG